MGNIVAIVGRPNVGKSTLFNRLVQRREAIVDAVSGVTRDRHYGKTDWNGREFSVIDTGGYVVGSDDVFEAEIDKQVELAIDEADAIIFMVDVESGVTGMDEAVANLLRKVKKPIFLVINKVDNADRATNAVEFYSLGLGEYYTIASINGSGTGDLLDAIVEALPKIDEEDVDELPRFAVVGRPNAGKSSFINALIGEERYIVTDIAGTTRDSNHTKYNRFGFDFNLVDTAGIRKKSKVKGKKVYSVKVKMPENYHFKKAELYLADIGDNAKRFKISPSLVLAIMKNESAFNPMARSHVPAFGLMQIVPSSAGVDAYDFIYKKKLVLGSSYLYNSKNNIELGTVYLHILDKRYLRKITNDESRLYCTIAAYNTGAGNVARVFTGNKNISKAAKVINKLTPKQVYNKLINDLPYEETKKYLQKVRNSMTRFQNI